MNRQIHRQNRSPDRYIDLSDLRDIHKGLKCFVVGAGPSLAFLDISPIHSNIVISVNSSAILMPWHEDGDISRRFWVSNDSLCMKWDYFWTHVNKFQCTKLIRTSWKKHIDKIDGKYFRFFSPKNNLSADDPGLCPVSSIPTSIDLAILMGCKIINLLGVDHKMIQGNSHFWQFYTDDKRPKRIGKSPKFKPDQKQQIKMFESNMAAFYFLKEYADSKGSRIYNCSSKSSLEIFPKISLEEALKID